MSEGARGCVLLVWLVAEVVTDDPKSACVSVCSLHTTDGRDNNSKKNKKTNKWLLLSCKVLWYIQLLFVRDFLCLLVYFCFQCPGCFTRHSNMVL